MGVGVAVIFRLGVLMGWYGVNFWSHSFEIQNYSMATAAKFGVVLTNNYEQCAKNLYKRMRAIYFALIVINMTF